MGIPMTVTVAGMLTLELEEKCDAAHLDACLWWDHAEWVGQQENRGLETGLRYAIWAVEQGFHRCPYRAVLDGMPVTTCAGPKNHTKSHTVPIGRVFFHDILDNLNWENRLNG